MRIKVLAFAASLLVIFSSSAGLSQTPTTMTSTQASALLAQTTKALIGTTAVKDVTLTGTVEWIAGPEDETGTVTYQGLSGAYRLDMNFRNGTRSEIASSINGVASGSWIGLDGVSHAMANHNLVSDAGWFPMFTLKELISSANTVLTYVGPENRNGDAVIHLRSSQGFPDLANDDVSFVQHLTQVDIYLDSTTLLPVSYAFNSHPDDNALLDIPTEIRYSNYQIVNGSQIPLRLQKCVNNTLILDLQFQSVSLNTGITAAQINAH